MFWERTGSFHWIAAESTDSSGQALLSRLPLGRLWLLAEAPGFARASSTLVLGAEQRALSISLHPAQALAVTVNDENAARDPAARPCSSTLRTHCRSARSLTQQGVARFSRLAGPPWSVKASAPGYESVSRAGVRGPLSLTLRRLASLEVAVLDVDGKPAPGATVMIAGATLWPARSALTQRRGPSAKITGLLAGSYDLRASLGANVAPTLLGFPLARGQNEKLTLRLEPGRTVVAVVTDGEGANPVAVANADVVLAEAGLSSFPIRGRTGSDGKVSLGPIASGPATAGRARRGLRGQRAGRGAGAVDRSGAGCRSLAAERSSVKSRTRAVSRSTARASKSSAAMPAACRSRRRPRWSAFAKITSLGRWPARCRSSRPGNWA